MALSGVTFGPTAGVPVEQAATSQVGVPDVVGTTRAVAEERLRTLGLTVRFRPILADGDPDTVFSQEPPARAVRPRKSVVTLQVVTVPPDSPDLGRKLDDLAAAMAGLETEAAAKARHEALMERLDRSVGTSDPTLGMPDKH